MLRENIVRILDTAKKSGEIQGVTVLKILSAARGQDKPPLLSDKRINEVEEEWLRGDEWNSDDAKLRMLF